MKKHDPLCPAPHPQLILPTICTYCQLINQVVERESKNSGIDGKWFYTDTKQLQNALERFFSDS